MSLVVSCEENAAFPALHLDEDWADKGGIMNAESVHLVNVTNGQRNFVTVRHTPRGSEQFAVHVAHTDSHRTDGCGSRLGGSADEDLFSL